MKTWEKILLYPIGLYLWLTDGIKKMSKKWKPAMAMLMAVVMLCGMLPATAFAVEAVSYLDSTGASQTCSEYTEVGNTATWETGWYYVNSDITFTDRITVSGNVSLILGDGTTLSATKGITVNKDNSLTIYAQSTGASMGKLTAGSQSDCAAIGGAFAHGGNITINGGDIQATGGNFAAGIGGGYESNGGNITISGGTVTATGGENGAGIGGGALGDGDNITISGGTVTANGGSAAAGIGGGSGGGNGGNITISGGKVNATGGSWGAGIGGGNSGDANIIVVYTTKTSLVNATAGSLASAYGNGNYGNNCYKVTFDSNGGSGDMGFLYVSKNTSAYSYALPACRFTAPAGKQFKAWNVGGAEKQPGDAVTFTAYTNIRAIWEPIKHTVSFAAGTGASGSMTPVDVEEGEYTLPSCTFTAPSNKTFKAWSVGGEEKQPGDKITVSANTTVTAVWQEVVEYGVYVGDEQFTSEKLTIDGTDGGTATFDPATNTVTLNNFKYSGTSGLRSTYIHDSLFGYKLNMVLVGENSIRGVMTDGALTITNGSGAEASLTAVCSDEYDGAAIYVGGTLKVNNVILDATGGKSGIWFMRAEVDEASVIISKGQKAFRTNGGDITLAASSVVFAGDDADSAQRVNAPTNDTYANKYVKIMPDYNVSISFDANSGTGTMADATVACGKEYTLPECGFTAPAGMQFKAWSVNGNEKQPGDKVVFMENAAVTAIWEDIPHTCSIEPVEKIWPDCENGGKEAYYKCEGCGKFFEDANGTTEIADIANWGNLPKNDHDYGTLKAAQPEIHTATELKASVAAHYFCDVCDTYFTEGKVATTLPELTGTVPSHNYANQYGYKGDDGHADTCSCGAKNTVVGHTADRPAPTETEDKKCSLCGFVIEPKTGHIHRNNLTPVVESGATCTTDGYKAHYKCSCGAYFEDATANIEIPDIAAWKNGAGKIAKKGHDYTEQIKDAAHLKAEAANCTECDTYWYDCSRCSANAKNDPAATNKFYTSTDAGDHNFNEKLADAAHLVAGTGTNCQDAKEYYYDCAHCAEIGTTSWASTTMGDHKFNTAEWGYKDKAAGHAHKCNFCTEHDTVQPHTPGAPATEDDDQICTTCLMVLETATGHICKSHLTKVAAEPATCTKDGNIEYYTCSCGKWYTDATASVEITDKDSVVIKGGHKYGTLVQEEPAVHTATELKPGMKAHYFCDKCDTYFTAEKVATSKDDLIIPAPTHEYTTQYGYKGADGHADTCSCGAHNTVVPHTPDRDAATETDPIKCTACGYEIAPALGHTCKNNLTKVAAEPATCTKDGNIEYYTCSCGKWYTDATASVEITDKDSVVIKAGHNYGTEWKSDKDNHWNECSACNGKTNSAAHKDANVDGKCDVCEYNVGVPSQPGDNPQTGDNSNMILWISLLMLSALGVVATTIIGKKRYSVK